MCMFTRAVHDVADTRIFARMEEGGRQLLVYQMSLRIDEALAMVLPVPVPPDAGENAIRFIDLERFPDFFRAVGERVPVWEDERRYDHDGETLSGRDTRFALLEVHVVGRYEASFVPTARDFERLDPRFRLPADVLGAVGAYADWSFAVFKLRDSSDKLEAVHPMAFSFPTRYRFSIFFPTVHAHDGKVHPLARFDHLLYFQAHVARKAGSQWYRDGEEVGVESVPQWPTDVQYRKSLFRMTDAFGKVLPEDRHFGRLRWGRDAPYGPEPSLVERSAGVLEAETPLAGFGLSGTLKNRDTWFHVDAL